MMIHKADTAFSIAVAATSAAGAAVTSDWSLEIFGVPMSVLLAGFSGSVVALAFLSPVTRAAMFAAVATGTLTSSYGVKLITHIAGWTTEHWTGVAFFVGLGAHFLLTLAFNNGPQWVRDFMRSKTGGQQ